MQVFFKALLNWRLVLKCFVRNKQKTKNSVKVFAIFIHEFFLIQNGFPKCYQSAIVTNGIKGNINRMNDRGEGWLWLGFGMDDVNNTPCTSTVDWSIAPGEGDKKATDGQIYWNYWKYIHYTTQNSSAIIPHTSF